MKLNKGTPPGNERRTLIKLLTRLWSWHQHKTSHCQLLFSTMWSRFIFGTGDHPPRAKDFRQPQCFHRAIFRISRTYKVRSRTRVLFLEQRSRV